ncbi:GGDEF domain-containing protein, partial [bacterium]|nr:GGDEF domain-containing protein [bacterium]
DELTGLYTFRYFKIRIEEEVTRCRRYRNSCALILWDIDHFKKINDSYGHPFGNVVLKKVAEVMKNSIRRDIDIPIRYGGEEMALILPQTDETGALILAERIRKQVESLEFPFEDTKVQVTISGGISCFPNHAQQADGITKLSDDALYQAKSGGRNRVIIATPEPKGS